MENGGFEWYNKMRVRGREKTKMSKGNPQFWGTKRNASFFVETSQKCFAHNWMDFLCNVKCKCKILNTKMYVL